jgi:hypothetical protein
MIRRIRRLSITNAKRALHSTPKKLQLHCVPRALLICVICGYYFGFGLKQASDLLTFQAGTAIARSKVVAAQ